MYESSLAIKRTGTLKTLNRAGSLLENLGVRLFDLDKNRILQQAARVAGFDFSDGKMEAGLDRLISSIQSEAHLNTLFSLGKTVHSRSGSVPTRTLRIPMNSNSSRIR